MTSLKWSKKCKALVTCHTCEEPPEPTVSLALCCPNGHGKLCSLIEKARQIGEAFGADLQKGRGQLEDYLAWLLDEKRITKELLARCRRKLNKRTYA